MVPKRNIFSLVKICEALVADEGAIEARVYEDINSDTNVVNIVRWNTEAEAENTWTALPSKSLFLSYYRSLRETLRQF